MSVVLWHIPVLTSHISRFPDQLMTLKQGGDLYAGYTYHVGELLASSGLQVDIIGLSYMQVYDTVYSFK